MRLTKFTDYALRALLYAGQHPDRLITASEISKAYGISRNHIVKVCRLLIQRGLFESVRGRYGGLRLGLAPVKINIGATVRKFEPDFDIVECFNRSSNTCPIVSACVVKDMFVEAQTQFLGVLDHYSLADMLANRDSLQRIWGERLKAKQKRTPN